MHLGWDCLFTLVSLAVCAAAPPTPDEDYAVWKSPAPNDTAFAREAVPTGPWIPPRRIATHGARYAPTIWRRGRYESVQVNVDQFGRNIIADAANEPSLAVDPTDPNRLVIGWRQFNSFASDFREAGWAYSHNGGHVWRFPGTLRPGQFGSDPVIECDAEGVFYYASLHHINNFGGWLFKSFDSGLTWDGPSLFNTGPLLDKEWMIIDRTSGTGRGHLYFLWTSSPLVRSTDGGETFAEQGPTGLDYEYWGTMSVGSGGEIYAVDRFFRVARSDNACNPAVFATFGTVSSSGTGSLRLFGPPNPFGLLGQAWIATDHSGGPTRGYVHVLGSTELSGETSGTRVRIATSRDRAETWSSPIEIHKGSGWQWFGMMDVAPNGRIDALWNDTRNTGAVNLSELHYSFSLDGGENWSPAVAVSPVFDSRIGWPGGNNKLGDYYDLTSDSRGVNVAYAATFNGEQDIYFLRIEQDCNFNNVPDHVEIAKGYAADCNDNLIPDECETFGDCTCDWIVTLADHAALVECLTGPKSTIGNRQSTIPSCLCADAHRDGAVDLADFARLQRFLTAP